MNIDLKNNLLQTNIFVDNEYLDKYIDLVIKPDNSKDPNVITEIHHIIPRAYYRYNNLPINDSPDNLIELDIKNHVLAHYYLCLCSKDKIFYYTNALCVSLISKRRFSDIDENWIMDNLPLLNEIRKNQRELNSKLQIGKQKGLKNGNCRYSYDICQEAKILLLEGKSDKEITNLTHIPGHVLIRIRNGDHWSCEHDGFTFTHKQTKELLKSLKEKEELELISSWALNHPTCKNCGKELTQYLHSKLGDGCFCSKHCILSYGDKEYNKKHPEKSQKIISKRRSYIGENNPNFGKKASKETREKISQGVKNSTCLITSSRFKGHTHTEETKEKIGSKFKSTIYMTNGQKTIRVKSNEVNKFLKLGFLKGRRFKGSKDEDTFKELLEK